MFGFPIGLENKANMNLEKVMASVPLEPQSVRVKDVLRCYIWRRVRSTLIT